MRFISKRILPVITIDEVLGGLVLCGLVILIYIAVLSTLPGDLR